jgi:hypothetical protein
MAVLHGPGYIMRYVNPPLCHVLGQEPEALLGRTLRRPRVGHHSFSGKVSSLPIAVPLNTGGYT